MSQFRFAKTKKLNVSKRRPWSIVAGGRRVAALYASIAAIAVLAIWLVLAPSGNNLAVEAGNSGGTPLSRAGAAANPTKAIAGAASLTNSGREKVINWRGSRSDHRAAQAPSVE